MPLLINVEVHHDPKGRCLRLPGFHWTTRAYRKLRICRCSGAVVTRNWTSGLIDAEGVDRGAASMLSFLSVHILTNGQNPNSTLATNTTLLQL